MKKTRFFSAMLFVLIPAASLQAQSGWFGLNSGTTNGLNSVHFITTEIGYVSGDGGLMLKTTNAGETWFSQTTPTTKHIWDVFFTSIDTGHAVGGYSNQSYVILKTTDGGDIWNLIQSGSGNTLTDAHFPDPDTGYAVGGDGMIFKTTDGGNNWTLLNSGTNRFLADVYFLDTKTGFTVGGNYNGWNSVILKTTDGGSTWSITDYPNIDFLAAVYFTHPDTGYVVGQLDSILKTVDGGNSWFKLNSGTTNNLNSVYFPDSRTGYASGSNGTIVKTTNAGNNWHLQESGVSVALGHIYFLNSNVGYTVGALSGKILKTTTGGENEILPVELALFAAETGIGMINLKWITESEVENYGFHVYRSISRDSQYEKITEEIIPGSGTSAKVHSYSYFDSDVIAGKTYYYKLADVDFAGNITFHGPISVSFIVQPETYSLSQNYPNPFNPKTNINFSLEKPGKVSLKIFNLQGELVHTLVNEQKMAGNHSASWNGTDQFGMRVTSGTYIYNLRVNGFEQNKKLIFMK